MKNKKVVREKAGEQKSTRFYSSKQENELARLNNGSVQPNSGATAMKKGDVSLEKLLLEAKCKMSNCDSFSIKKDWIVKNRHEACFMGKQYSALAFNFGPDQENFYVIDQELFDILLGRL